MLVTLVLIARVSGVWSAFWKLERDRSLGEE